MGLGPKGIDVRQTSGQLVFRAQLYDAYGSIVTSGTTSLRLYEVQDDATLKSYDFNDNTFKSTGLTTETLAMAHRTGNNSTTNTGLWTVALSTLSGFTKGGIYIAQVVNSSAGPAVQSREFQFGSAQGDLAVTSTTNMLKVDAEELLGTAFATPDAAGYPKVTIKSGTGTGELDITSGIVKSALTKILGTTLTETATGYLSAAFKKLFDVATPVFTAASVNQTGDAYTDTQTLLGRVTAARAGYWDNLNVGGAVASQADVNSLNTSSSRRIILTSVQQFERPESGTVTYTIEARTYDGDGAATNADSTPTLTGTGTATGSLAANLSAASNPATGLYRWTYTVSSTHNVEQTRFDISAVIGGGTFTLSLYAQVTDMVSATWTSTDASHLTAIFNKLPSKSYLTGTDNSDGDVEMDEATGDFPGSVGSISGVTFPSNFGSLAINGSGHIILQDGSLVTAKLGTFVLAKTTNITGFNDIAATAIVSNGAITTNGSGGVTTVVSLTNLPAITTGWITAAGIAAGALNGKGDWLLSSGYTPPPSAATIAALILATPENKIYTGSGGEVKLSDVDGLSDAVFRQALLSYFAGESTMVDNGDGTKTITYKRQNGTTASLAITFNAQGEWTATEITA